MTSKPRKIPKLGNIVRDITTGFTGMATQYVEMSSGTVQLAVQPQLPDGATNTGDALAIPAALSIDLPQLDFVADGAADRVLPAAPQTIALGNEVEDMVSGLRGIVVTRTTFINGCVYYNVQPKQTAKQKEEGTFTDSAFLPSQRLEIKGDGIARKIAPATAAPVSERPGGPTTRAQRPR
jgi:hypothetical protein